MKIRSSFQKLIAPHLTHNSPQEIQYTTEAPTESETGAFEEPTEPEQPTGHAITCEEVAEKAIGLIATEAEAQLAKLTPEQQAQAIEEVKANLPAFLEQFLAQCQQEAWPDKDRRCVLDAPDLARASKCGIE